MKKQFETFKQSLKLKKNFVYIFLIDFVFSIVIAILYTLMNKFFDYQMKNYSGGHTPEQIQQFLLTASQEQLSAFLSETKIYLVSLFGTFFLFCLITLALLALSQALIWHLITSKKLTKKNYFKWIFFIINFIIVLAVTITVFVLIKLLVLIIANQINFSLGSSLNQLLNLIYFLAFFFVFFLSCYYFTKNPRIFQSLAHAFSLIKQKFKNIFLAYLFSLTVAVILSLILYLIFKAVPSFQIYINYFNLFLSLFFLAWLRLYLVKIVQ